MPFARFSLRVAVVAVLTCHGTGCADGSVTSTGSSAGDPVRGSSSAGAPAVDTPTAEPRPQPRTERPRIVFLGDSLTAGLGLSVESSYPSLIQRKIDQDDLGYEVVNAGVSGDTTAGGVRRFDWSMEGDVRILVLALGANDGLRGLAVTDMQRNLQTMVDRARSRGIEVLLCGMEAPPNFGAQYATQYRQAFATLGAQPGVRFVPFLLDGIAGVPAFNQADGIHPNAEGARRVADLLWAALRPMLVAASS